MVRCLLALLPLLQDPSRPSSRLSGALHPHGRTSSSDSSHFRLLSFRRRHDLHTSLNSSPLAGEELFFSRTPLPHGHPEGASAWRFERCSHNHAVERCAVELCVARSFFARSAHQLGPVFSPERNPRRPRRTRRAPVRVAICITWKIRSRPSACFPNSPGSYQSADSHFV